MQIKFKEQVKFSQVPQKNPLKFAFLYKEEDGSFTDQTSFFRCKDFFNDIVAGKKGDFFSVYNFKNQDLKFNETEAHICLDNVVTDGTWEQNMALIGEQLEKEGYGKIEYAHYEKNKWLLTIPISCLDNTYTISLLTLLVRVSNYNHVFTSFEEMLRNEFEPAPKGCTGFTFEKLVDKKYWWWAGAKYNSHSSKGSVVHNQGIHSHHFALEQGY